jgi:hypothetical protein
MIRIYGAGMAGLLSSVMLARLTGGRPVVKDAQPALPDNHGALLRFRTNAVSEVTGIPFKKVHVFKAVHSGGRLRPVASLRDVNMYSYKVTGSIMPRSILDLTQCTRYIAPPDFLAQLARDQVIQLNSPLAMSGLYETQNLQDSHANPIVSTIPMPVLMDIVGWQAKPSFRWLPIWSVVVEFAEPVIDIYQTVYYPELVVPHYRASFTGNKCIIEFAMEPDETMVSRAVHAARADFGITRSVYTVHEVKRQEYGKLLPLTDLGEQVRREFIMAMTDNYNIYSVGRFATWRQILLDDVVDDVMTVSRMILGRDGYARRLSGVKV